MKGESLSYQNFTVYPECCDLSLNYLINKSMESKRYQIAALELDSQIKAMVFHNGRNIYTRSKYSLHESEIIRGIKPGILIPDTVNLGGKVTLILICYELIFPEDYLLIGEKIDMVIHMVGTPMHNEEQREAWVALQKSLSIVHECPVLCCCGGQKGRMNITGVIEAPNES